MNYERKKREIKQDDFVAAMNSLGCDVGDEPAAMSAVFANGFVVFRWSDRIEDGKQIENTSGRGIFSDRRSDASSDDATEGDAVESGDSAEDRTGG